MIEAKENNQNLYERYPRLKTRTEWFRKDFFTKVFKAENNIYDYYEIDWNPVIYDFKKNGSYIYENWTWKKWPSIVQLEKNAKQISSEFFEMKFPWIEYIYNEKNI